jgi:hypothetical protein
MRESIAEDKAMEAAWRSDQRELTPYAEFKRGWKARAALAAAEHVPAEDAERNE